MKGSLSPSQKLHSQVEDHTTLDYLDDILFSGHMYVNKHDTMSTKGMGATQRNTP